MSQSYANTGRIAGLRVAGSTAETVLVSRTFRAAPAGLTIRNGAPRKARRPVAEMIVDTGDRWAQTFNTEGRRVPRHYR